MPTDLQRNWNIAKAYIKSGPNIKNILNALKYILDGPSKYQTGLPEMLPGFLIKGLLRGNLLERRLTKDYNRWDFEVTMNMIKSDMYPILKEWFPEEKDLRDKIIELSINWLNDEDYPDHKIWNYFK